MLVLLDFELVLVMVVVLVLVQRNILLKIWWVEQVVCLALVLVPNGFRYGRPAA